MIGNSLLVTPVLEEGATSVTGYFPESAVWYDFFSAQRFTPDNGGYSTLSAPQGTLPMHLMGGSALLMQTPSMTTAATRLNPFTLVCALDASFACVGSVYQDDGVSIKPSGYTAIFFRGNLANGGGGSIAGVPVSSAYTIPSLVSVSVWGATHMPTSVTLNGAVVPPSSVSLQNNVLSFAPLNITLTKAWQLVWHV